MKKFLVQEHHHEHGCNASDSATNEHENSTQKIMETMQSNNKKP